MKKFFLLLIAIFINHLLFAQIGYKVQNKFIALKEKDTFTYFIQTKDEDFMKKSVALNVMKNTGKILEFQKISQNRFVVSTSSTNLNKEDYVSKIYESSYNPQGKIIILPRISLQLKNNRTIKNILDVCNTKVSIEKNNHQKYIKM